MHWVHTLAVKQHLGNQQGFLCHLCLPLMPLMSATVQVTTMFFIFQVNRQVHLQRVPLEAGPPAADL
jgi:hypothetical protein